MTQKVEDLRVRRTRKLLRDALISLIEQEQRSFEAITVGEIAARAMVSRAAFYRYYQDKYDMVEQIFEETITTMIGELDQWRQKFIGDIPPLLLVSDYHLYLTDKEFPPDPWVKVFEHFAAYANLYRALLGENGSLWFRKKMRSYLTDVLIERFKIREIVFQQNTTPLADKPVFQAGLMPMLLAGQLLDIISWWLEHELPYPPRQIAAYSHRLMIASLREASMWD